MQSRLSISPLPLDIGLLTSMASYDEKRQSGGGESSSKAKKTKRSRPKKKTKINNKAGKSARGSKGSSSSSTSLAATKTSAKKRGRSPSVDAQARQAGLARGFAAFAKNTGIDEPSSKKRKKVPTEHKIPDDLFRFGEFSEITMEDALDDHRCAGIIRRLGALKYTQQVRRCGYAFLYPQHYLSSQCI